MNILVNLNGVGLNELAACFIVAFALNALDFGKKLAEEVAQGFVVVDLNVGCLTPDMRS